MNGKTPLLFEKGTTNFGALAFGIGFLADCVSCKVTEERNGGYELEMEYPKTGVLANELTVDRYIYCPHDDNGDFQAFRIYAVSKPLNGVITVNAEHISYLLGYTTVRDVTGGYRDKIVSEAFYELFESAEAVHPNFEFEYDIDGTFTATKPFAFYQPVTVRGAIGGEDGSILELYGGEIEWDMFTVKYSAARGANNGVEIRYGKNLESLKADADAGGCYNYVLPYWVGAEQVVICNNIVSVSEHQQDFGRPMALPLDVTEILGTEEEYVPTQIELVQAARSVLNNTAPWAIKQSIDVSFVPLSQTEEYKQFSQLESVRLCDTVKVVYPAQNISVDMKVTKVIWDVLKGKYEHIELGVPRATISSAVSAQEASAGGGGGAISGEEIARLEALILQEKNRAQIAEGGLQTQVNAKQDKDVVEQYTIATTSWTAVSGVEPYTYECYATPSYDVGDDTKIELLMSDLQNPIFAKHGFAINTFNMQAGRLYIQSIGLPTEQITFTVGFVG